MLLIDQMSEVFISKIFKLKTSRCVGTDGLNVLFIILHDHD